MRPLQPGTPTVSVLTLALLGVIGLLVGVLIGCIGVGGVLLVPALAYVAGIDIHIAIASCMLSYVFSGLVGGIAFARKGSVPWSLAGWLFAGAMPGAFAGAAAVALVPGRVLEFLIATLVLLAGVQALAKRAGDGDARDTIGRWKLAGIGVFTGVGSAMSGTGGPLILVPILVWMRVPVLTAVGLSQVVQLPIATLATVGNLRYGEVDLTLGLTIAVLLMAGVTVGARLAHRLPSASLRRIVAWSLVVVGLFVFARATWASIAGA